MPSVNIILLLALCLFGVTDGITSSANISEAADRVAEVRENWLTAFKTKDVNKALSFYTSDAAFLQPTGERIEGIAAIRELYQKVVSSFDTDLVLTSRLLKVSNDLAFDSGEYDESLTNRATAQKNNCRGQYVMIFRRGEDRHWRIIQHVWTLVPNPASDSAPP